MVPTGGGRGHGSSRPSDALLDGGPKRGAAACSVADSQPGGCRPETEDDKATRRRTLALLQGEKKAKDDAAEGAGACPGHNNKTTSRDALVGKPGVARN
jgi:hypothetical protein